MHPFAPREIEFVGTRALHGWKVKVYGVHLAGAPLDWASFEAALDDSLGDLPEPDLDRGRPGLGFFIAHQGATGDYAVLAWWNHENELPLRIAVRRQAGDPWRPATTGESVCIWDLEIIWEERNAWIETMLTEAGPDREEYLRRVPERFSRRRGDGLA